MTSPDKTRYLLRTTNQREVEDVEQAFAPHRHPPNKEPHNQVTDEPVAAQTAAVGANNSQSVQLTRTDQIWAPTQLQLSQVVFK